MKLQVLLKKLIIVPVAAVIIYVAIAAGRIRQINIVDQQVAEQGILLKAQDCMEQYKGKSLWTLSRENVRRTLLGCDQVFVETLVQYMFPGKLEVSITLFDPYVRIDASNTECILLTSSSKKITLPLERCISYQVPLLTGAEVQQNIFVQDYVCELSKQLQQHNIKAKTIEYRGDTVAPWYMITLSSGGKVYFPSSAAVSEKTTILEAALKGLNEAKERYSTIDVRFDRVVYK